MTDPNSPKTGDNRVPPHPVVFVWPDRNGRIDADWLARVQARFPGTWTAPAGAGADGVKDLDVAGRDLAAACAALRRLAGDRFWLLTAGTEPPEDAWSRLARDLDDDTPRIRLPTSNADPLLDPRPDADTDATETDRLVAACGWQVDWPVEPGWPADCAVLNRAAVERLATGGELPAAVLDTIYVAHPAPPPRGPQRPASALGPLGHLRERLAGLTAEGTGTLPCFNDGRPVTLHVTHHWGGGIARWIDDVVAGDTRGDHLVLAAGCDEQDRRYGQWLRLYAAGAERGCLRSWQLAPAILDTDTAHAGYRAALEWILDRYGVDRVLVSSLIGHALDCLDTGLPTVQVLHDGYPAWPLLDIDPETVDGDLARGLTEHGDTLLFAHDRAEYWKALAGRWLERIHAGDIPLAAPSEAAIQRWRQVLGTRLPEVAHIPHGFAGWPNPPDWTPHPAGDRPLRLVVVGRVNAGKGLNLLHAALPALRQHARLTLLGAGRAAQSQRGHRGNDNNTDYKHADLPAWIARLRPDAALFLSTVPETWNYTLGEVRALGVVPVATRRGSFTERIRDGVDGVLIDPDPGTLVEAVGALADHPEHLATLRDRLPEEPGIKAMLAAYDRLAPPGDRHPRAPVPADSASIQLAWRAGDGADLAGRLEQTLERADTLQREAEERAHWAQTMERQFRQRSAWAERLDAEAADLRETLATVRDDLGAARVTEQRLNSEIDDLAARIDQLENERQQLLTSRSWRLTRPLRVGMRLAHNLKRYRVYNPARWPHLVAAFLHDVRYRGWRNTLFRIQSSEVEEQAPETVIPVAVPEPDQPLTEVSLRTSDTPRASIVIPVYNKVHYTAACLHSLAACPVDATYEVIVVNDASGDETAEYLARCEGLRVVNNRENLGFIGSCNRGAGVARGEWLVFLNNDTTVTDHWLDALIDAAEREPQAGIVGARLVYPDGRLQEAGGIVFDDATGWNWGRGDHPDRPEYRFVSECDYVSGACLAIQKSLFDQLDGFDAHFAPAYYEDTDLCFRVRREGLKVLYQPAATVVHHEGATSGTDESSGAKRYQAINREKFRERWRETLARHPAPIGSPDNRVAGRHARHRRARGRILVIDATTPTPDHDSGSLRMYALLRILHDGGWRVTFAPENLAWFGRYSEALQHDGVEVLCAPWVTEIETWLNEQGHELDWVFVSRHDVLAPILQIIRTTAPRARLVFDTVDLHFLREQREAELTGSARIRRKARHTRRQELNMIRAADHTLVVSPAEHELLASLVPDADVHVVSNIHAVHGSGQSFEERRDLLFVGGFQHQPNVDAATWLIREIFPQIREQLPEVRLHIIGSRMPPSVRELESTGVILHGFVPDLEPWLTGCRLSLAPLRYGAGVKGKVNQAMAYGLPVVATSCAAEGMYLEHGHDVLVGDDAETFAEQVVIAYSDPEIWSRLAMGGQANVRDHFSFEAAHTAIERLFACAGKPGDESNPESLKIEIGG